MKTKDQINETLKRLHEAEQAVKDAKAAHRAAFRVALVALFNEYRFYLDAYGTEGASLCIAEFREFQSEYRIEDLPE